nr:hypothetical protein QIA40_04325 [Borreliella lusitaniae]
MKFFFESMFANINDVVLFPTPPLIEAIVKIRIIFLQVSFR